MLRRGGDELLWVRRCHLLLIECGGTSNERAINHSHNRTERKGGEGGRVTVVALSSQLYLLPPLTPARGAMEWLKHFGAFARDPVFPCCKSCMTKKQKHELFLLHSGDLTSFPSLFASGWGGGRRWWFLSFSPPLSLDGASS